MTIEGGPADAGTTSLRAKQADASFAASVTFRAATDADVPALVPLINKAYQREAWLFPGPRITDEALLEEMRSGQCDVVIAEVDGSAAGTLRLRQKDDGAWFGLLATAPPFQGRGLAGMLIAQAEDLARGSGSTELRLDCAAELGLPPFYASLGYVVELVEENAYFKPGKGPFTRVVMVKQL